LDRGERIVAWRGRVRREEPMEESGRLHGGTAGERLSQMGQPDQQQYHEGDGGQQRVEGERAGEKRNVVFVGGLQGAAEEAGGGPMPPAGTDAAQASGSSRSPTARRRARASDNRRSSSSRAEGPPARGRMAGRSSGSSSASSSSSSRSVKASLPLPNCWASSSSFSSVIARSFHSRRCRCRRVSSPLRGA